MAVDYGVQVVDNLNAGLPFGEAVYYKNIDTQELGGWTLGGTFAGGISGGIIAAAPEAAAACIAAGCDKKAPALIQKAINAVAGNSPKLDNAFSIGSTPVEAATELSKLESQLMSKANVLGIQKAGNMSNLNNPQVQAGLSRINDVSSNADRIWSGTWKGQPALEYIRDGIGVVRDPATGRLLTVLERPDLSNLQKFVDNGTAEWLK